MSLPSPAKDRTCVVTGASSGIGREIARELARRGHGLTLVARREDRLRSLADELSSAHGIRAETIAADLTEPESRAAILTRLADLGLTPDILINNAGFSTTGPVHESERDEETRMVRTDVEAVADLCVLFLPGMVERGAGSVLNVASSAAFQPIPFQAGYAASKSFVLSYSRAVRAELAGTGVNLSALCPGPVKTEFTDIAGFDPGRLNGLPGAVWQSVESVAKAGVDGMDAGKAMIVPGLVNKAGAIGGYLTPRSVLVPVLKRFWPAS